MSDTALCRTAPATPGLLPRKIQQLAGKIIFLKNITDLNKSRKRQRVEVTTSGKTSNNRFLVSHSELLLSYQNKLFFYLHFFFEGSNSYLE